jgi:phage gp29-like protein
MVMKTRPPLDELGVGAIRTRYSSYPSQGLTPERLAAVLREADQGDVLRQAELFEEMEEKDAHLGSVLQTRKLAVTGLDWDVVPSGEDSQAQATAAFVREALDRIQNREEALLDLLDAVGKGFSISEILWELEGDRVWIRGLRWRHPKEFTFMTPAGPSPTPRFLTEEAPLWGEELPADKFALHRFRSRAGTLSRAGILRPCAYLYLFKNYTIKDWVVFNERFAMPLRVGKYRPGASEHERQVLRNAVFNLASDAAAVISDATVIELLDTSGKAASADGYRALVEFCDRSMSKAVLGQTLTTEQTGGAYATARVHQMVRQDLLEADARALASTITSQLIRPLVAFNFGPGTPLPRFEFHHQAGEDLREAAETYRAIAQMGVPVPASFIYQRFGIPEPEGTEKGAHHE